LHVASALSGANNFTNVTVNANGSGSIDQTAVTLSGGIPYIVKNDYSWNGDSSLALATAVMSRGIGKICAVGITAQVRNNSVGISVSGSGVGVTANGHSSAGYQSQASGTDMRSASPLFKTVPIGVYPSYAIEAAIFLSPRHSGDLEKAFLRFSIIRPRYYRLTETPIWTSASAIRRSSAACLSGTHGE
jgi:hypothetical protein